ncbi:hypothetical protein DH09_11265 [Bacillaceae bacterium JMAK1]|nr:hypothetical protein DH09_11265 [Bacillaceae bacterium JMAK1]
MTSAEIVVIGAGVIGTSIAFRLAESGRQVMMIDRNGIGAATSSACDKAIFLQSKRPGLHMDLARESRNMYNTLEEELGQSVEFKGAGGTVAIHTEQQMLFMKKFVHDQTQAGINVSLLNQKEAKEQQPILADDIIGASYSPDDAEVNPLKLSQGFATAAKRLGVEIMTHTEAIGIEKSNGKVTGVKTSKGVISTETVINACGPFASSIARFSGVPMNIKPRRGVILISEKVDPIVNGSLLDAQYIAAKHLSGQQPEYGIGLSLGQTDSGNLLIGGSREFVGFNKHVHSDVLHAIAYHACKVVPALTNIRIIRSMVGFRPFTGDGLPIIDRSEQLRGYILAAGHEGDGIALSPITGCLVRDLLNGGGPTSRFLPHLTSDRFKEKTLL